MNINNIFSNTNHPKSIVNQIKSAQGLPFQDILSSESIVNNIKGMCYRERIYTPDIILWVFLSQVLSDDKSCQAAVMRVVAHFISQHKQPPSSNTAAYTKARSRFPEKILSNLTRESAKQMEEQVQPNWLWKNRHIKLVDGSTLSMADTPENQAAFPQSKIQKPGIGFPMARILAVISYTTGAILDLAIAPYAGKGTGETSLLRQVMGNFNPGDVVLGDGCYASFFLMATLIKNKVDGVFPILGGRNYNFRLGKRLGKKDHLVKLNKPQKPKWMSRETYSRFPESIIIREVAIQSVKKGFRSRSRILVTTFLDPKQITKDDLEKLYPCRWHIELDLRAIKDTMHMGILRGKTPAIVKKEIWAHALAYNLIRKIMAQAACVHHKNPRELSFKLALRSIETFRLLGILSEESSSYQLLLKTLSSRRIGNRTGRQEPRRVKRRRQVYKLLVKPRKTYHQELIQNAIS